MQQSDQTVPSAEATTLLLVCPICWSHEGVEQVTDIVLSARAMGGRDLSQVSAYRCPRWHLFVLLNQPEDLR
jgi:hypothetical protein